MEISGAQVSINDKGRVELILHVGTVKKKIKDFVEVTNLQEGELVYTRLYYEHNPLLANPAITKVRRSKQDYRITLGKRIMENSDSFLYKRGGGFSVLVVDRGEYLEILPLAC